MGGGGVPDVTSVVPADGNLAGGDGSAVVGGQANTVMSDFGFIGGGVDNHVSGKAATAIGGLYVVMVMAWLGMFGWERVVGECASDQAT